MLQPLFIGPYDLGVHSNLKPFMIPEKAFQSLINAYVFRGRIQKKMGHSSLGRLRRVLVAASVGNISSPGAGNVTLNLFNALGIAVSQPNAQIDVDSTTVISIGAPISTTLTDVSKDGNLTSSNPAAISAATINYSTGIVTMTFTGAFAASAATLSAAYFPGLPVMALPLYERDDINFEKTLAFDTVYAYEFVGTSWIELPSTTPKTWTGTDSQFFWATNYYYDTAGAKLFWVTNFNMAGSASDPIRYYNDTTWTDFTPDTDSTTNKKLITSLILIPYKDRLVALNTYEQIDAGPNFQQFPQRARWSQNGSPIAAEAWRDDVTGRGGYIDAGTNEAIISVGFIKDNLVVYFERSTWMLVYTGNEVLPFIWQRISQELGAESTFSNVVFDNGLIAFGNVGLHTCNGVTVRRIDAVIPDTVFQIQNDSQGPQRVHAIRDFINELVYFTYPDATAPSTDLKFPNQVLVYNYRNDTFSFFRENFTCYGYFQRTNPIVWSILVAGSGYSPWSSWTTPWASGLLQAEVPDICAGNQQGFVVRLATDSFANSETYSIYSIVTDTITSPDHNLAVGDFVQVLDCLGATNFNDNIYRVQTVPDKDSFTVVDTISGTYLGNGKLKVLSNIQILTKQFNPFWKNTDRFRLVKIEFLFDRTAVGEVSANVYVDMSQEYSVSNSVDNPAVLGTNTVLTRPEPNLFGPGQNTQDQIWHRMYSYTEGETFQIEVLLSDTQMLNLELSESDITLHAMVFHFKDAGDFL